MVHIIHMLCVPWDNVDVPCGWDSVLPYSGYFSRDVYFTDFVQRAQFVNFEISKI